ncbi:hypothetical protein F4803DRAFT_432537 [Xylaria telfairii]|nr:hypothetical protein F4803DRAFT_432537 [Xylaria telfairii]
MMDRASRVPGVAIPFRACMDRKGFQGTIPGAEPAEIPKYAALGEVVPFNRNKVKDAGLEKEKARLPDVVGHGARPYRLEHLVGSGTSPTTYKVEVVTRKSKNRPILNLKVSSKEFALACTTIPIDIQDTRKPISGTHVTLEQLKDTARSICERAFDRLVSVDLRTQWAIRDAIFRYHGLGPKDVDFCVTSTSHAERFGKHIYRSVFPIVDPESDGRIMKVKVNASRIDDTMDIPAVPEDVIMTAGGYYDRRAASPAIPAFVESRQRRQHELAANLAAYIAYTFAGSYDSPQSIRRKIKALQSSYCLPVTTRDGVVRGAAVVARVCRRFAVARVKPANWVRNHFPGLPNLTIRSPTFLRTYETMQAMIEAFEGGEHVIDVWRRGAEVADIENQRIDQDIRVVQTARCEKGDRWHSHPCHSCAAQPLCFTMSEVPELNMRVCHACSKRPVQELRQDDNPTPASRPLLNVAPLVRGDYKAAGKSPEDLKNSVGERRVLVHQMCVELAKQRTIGGWRDRYCFRDMRDVEVYQHFTVRGIHRSPLNPSVDAVCLVPGDGPGAGPHVPGNVVITAWALNSIKASNPPLALKALAQYRRSDTRAGLANAFRGLLVAYIIGRMARFCSGRTTEQERRALRQAWVSGRLPRMPIPSDRVFCLGIPDRQLRRHGPQWRPDSHAWLVSQYDQIPAMYGFEKDQRALWSIKGPDGDWVPYPFDPESKPFVTWSWWYWQCFLDVRYERTSRMCNRGHEMDCDVYTYQLCLMHGHFEKLQADRERLRVARVSEPHPQVVSSQGRRRR